MQKLMGRGAGIEGEGILELRAEIEGDGEGVMD